MRPLSSRDCYFLRQKLSRMFLKLTHTDNVDPNYALFASARFSVMIFIGDVALKEVEYFHRRKYNLISRVIKAIKFLNYRINLVS